MIKRSYPDPKLKTKVVRIDNFTDILDYSLNCLAGKSKIFSGLKLCKTGDMFNKAGEIAKRIEKVDDKVFIITESGKVYKKEGEEFILISDTNFIDPEIISVKENGKEVYIISDKNKAVKIVDGVEESISLPCGKFTVANGMLFIGCGNTICFSSAYDYSNFSVSAKAGGEIILPSEYGKVLDVFGMDREVIILLTRGVLSISLTGEKTDFSLNKVVKFNLGIIKDSACAYNDKIYFIGGNTLYSYDKSGLKQLLTLKSQNNFDYISRASIINGTYVIGLKSNASLDNKTNLLVDLNEMSSYFSTYKNLVFCNDFALNYFTGELLSFCEKDFESYISDYYKSIPLSFDSLDEKCLRRITISTETPVSLKVYSEKGKSFFEILDGVSSVDLKLDGKKFCFELVGKPILNVNSITVEYTIKE